MGLQRFTEAYSISKEDIIPYPVQEATAEPLQESIQGKEYNCISRYRVPVSKINTTESKNLNGRVYGRSLWENVIRGQKQVWEGCVGLADHPSDNSDGSVRDIFAVWHNLSLNESKGIVEADIHLIGPYGKLAEEVIQAGGKLGFSSSGFGELMEDGSTVNPSTYMLERISDWVLTPSQEVYGTKDMKLKTENTTNSIKEKKENQMAESTTPKVSKLEERKFRKDVETFLTEAIAIKDPKERLAGLKEIHTYFDEGVAQDLKESVDKEIEKTEAQIDSILKEHVKLVDTFGVDSTEGLKEGIARVVVDKRTADSQSRDWKKVSESLQAKIKQLQESLEKNPSPENYETAISFNRRIRMSFLEKKRALQEQAQTLQDQIEGQKAVAAKLTELAKLSIQSKKLMEKKVAELMKSLQESKKETADSKTLLTEAYKKMERMTVKYESAPKVETRKKTMPVEFTEKKEVDAYWKDIYSRHGKDILPLKERVLVCKTLREAMQLYTNFLPKMQEVAVLPGNVSKVDRLKYLKETTGRTIVEKKSLNLPEGWI